MQANPNDTDGRTDWRAIEASLNDGAALGKLLKKYEPIVLRFFASRFGRDPGRAEEWAHDFVADRMVLGNLLRKAVERDDPAKRFRSLLFTAAHNWAVDQLREQVAHSTTADEGADLAAPAGDPALAFDEMWVSAVLRDTIGRLHAELAAARPSFWNVFRARYLLDPPWSHRQCSEAFGFRTLGQVAHADRTVRDRSRELLRERLREELFWNKDLDAAEADLLTVAGRSKGELHDPGFVVPASWSFDSRVMTSPAPPRETAAKMLRQSDPAEVLAETLALSAVEELGITAMPAISDQTTIGEILANPSADLEHLNRIKQFAKQSRGGTTPLLPDLLATWLYYAAAAAALVRHNRRITSLDDAALQQGLHWARQAPWGDPHLHAVFDAALGHGAELDVG